MADPRTEGPALGSKKDRRSDLMKAKSASGGEVVNVCPYGCDVGDLDERTGYCKHLVGFTNDKKHMEPMVYGPNGRVVQVKRERIKKQGPQGEFWEWGPPQYESVLKSDRLVQITSSYRVYRDVDRVKTSEG